MFLPCRCLVLKEGSDLPGPWHFPKSVLTDLGKKAQHKLRAINSPKHDPERGSLSRFRMFYK